MPSSLAGSSGLASFIIHLPPLQACRFTTETIFRNWASSLIIKTKPPGEDVVRDVGRAAGRVAGRAVCRYVGRAVCRAVGRWFG